MKMSKFYDQFWCEENTTYSLVIDDDGKVAYAYLLYDDKIIADVWLYNQQLTPITTDWSDKSKMPFLNPSRYTSKKEFTPINESNEITFNWVVNSVAELESVDIYLRESIIARLVPGAKPGWSILAQKDGPLAKVLNL